jgi:hypothetical protein
LRGFLAPLGATRRGFFVHGESEMRAGKERDQLLAMASTFEA